MRSNFSSPTWLKVSTIHRENLRHEADAGGLYAVMDACCSEDFLLRIAEIEKDRLLCLYRGHAAKNFAAQAPYLIAVNTGLLDWIETHFKDKNWGIFVLSQQPILETHAHLRKFLTVDSPEGKHWLFRFYDPRILPAFLLACNDIEGAEFFGGARALILPQPTGDAKKFERARALPPQSAPQRRGVGTRFALRSQHLAAFYPTLNEHVPDDLVRTLRQKGHAIERDSASGDLVGYDARGFATRLSFGVDNLPSRLELPSKAIFQFKNESSGRIRTLTYPGGESIELEHDGQGRLISARQPELSTYQFKYDDSGLLNEVTHPDGTQDSIEYMESGHVSKIKGRAGDATKYSYQNGKLRTIIDPLRRHTTLDWDSTGGLASISFPDGSQECFEYHPDSGVAIQTLRDGSQVFRHLDDKGDLKQIQWSDGSTIHLAVDEGGRLRGAENDHSRTEYTYNSSGQLLSESTNGERITFEYDGDGRLTAFVPFSQEPVRYEYDQDGRLCGVKVWGQQLSIKSSPLGSIENIRYGKDLIEDRVYHRGGRITHAQVRNAVGECLSEQLYAYDACERLGACRGIDQRVSDA